MNVAGSVSAVIPSYNYGRFVADAVESALAQEYTPALEVIVVDDGSTDDTRERLTRFAGRIRYVYQSNRGLPAARNTGIRTARGEWVAFLDADDIWHREKTIIQMRAAAAHGFDVVGSPRFDLPVGPLDEVASMPFSTEPVTRRCEMIDLLMGTPIHGSSTIARRRAFDEVGMFDESLRSSEDRDMWLRLGARFAIGSVDGPFAFYRAHGAQMSRNAPRMMECLKRVFDRFFAGHPEHASLTELAHAFLYVDAALAHMEAGARRDAVRYLVRSLRIHAWEPTSGRACLSTMRRSKLLVRALMGEELFGAALRCERAFARPLRRWRNAR